MQKEIKNSFTSTWLGPHFDTGSKSGQFCFIGNWYILSAISEEQKRTHDISQGDWESGEGGSTWKGSLRDLHTPHAQSVFNLHIKRVSNHRKHRHRGQQN